MEIVGEIGINASGDVEIAKKLIDIAKFVGCDYVKFQKRTIDHVYTEEELNKPRESPWGTTTREQKHGIEFEVKEYREIDQYCKQRGMKWFASPFDVLSIGFLNYFKTPFIKIASPMLTNRVLLEACVGYDNQVILSTGMSTLKEVDEAVEILGKDRIYCIMHCTSTYPTKTEEMNLRCITSLRERYPWTKIGFSNHHPGLVFMSAAVALGAEMVEFHITLDKLSYGSDQAASFNPEGIIKTCKYMRDVEVALGDGIKVVYDSERPIMEKLRK